MANYKRPLRIDIICNDGSPIGVIPPTIYDNGVGGAELSLMCFAKTMAARGHAVAIYNDPIAPGNYDGVEYRHRSIFMPRDPRDALVIFRSPNPLAVGATAKLRKLWWSCDQVTVGDFSTLATTVDFCVTISPFHTRYHREKYGIAKERIGHIDLGVLVDEYREQEGDVKKVPGQMIYCSVPSRGLAILRVAWPLILREAPMATLKITSDYRLWGCATAGNDQHRISWAGVRGVTFLGRVPRRELVRLQLQSEVMPYPCTYDELHCIAASECQVAGALPVTPPRAALETTNEFGLHVPGVTDNHSWVKKFSSLVASLVTNERDYLEQRQSTMVASARQRWDWNNIAERWERLIVDGKLPDVGAKEDDGGEGKV